jgi:hypothetical protein
LPLKGICILTVIIIELGITIALQQLAPLI